MLCVCGILLYYFLASSFIRIIEFYVIYLPIIQVCSFFSVTLTLEVPNDLYTIK